MTHEWKEGDRVRLEGVISEVDGDEDCWIQFEDGIVSIFDNADMKHAKLIQPAATEPPKLDVTKLMRVQRTGIEERYIGRLSDGRIICEPVLGSAEVHDFWEHELENIPEPEEVLEYRLAIECIGEHTQIRQDRGQFTLDSIMARVTWSKSQGWRIEDAEGEV